MRRMQYGMVLLHGALNKRGNGDDGIAWHAHKDSKRALLHGTPNKDAIWSGGIAWCAKLGFRAVIRGWWYCMMHEIRMKYGVGDNTCTHLHWTDRWIFRQHLQRQNVDKFLMLFKNTGSLDNFGPRSNHALRMQFAFSELWIFIFQFKKKPKSNRIILSSWNVYVNNRCSCTFWHLDAML